MPTSRLSIALATVLVAVASLSAVVDATETADVPTAAAPTASLVPWTDAWLLAHTDSYLHDGAKRRAVLEHALTNPDNLYARMRIAAYGLGDSGWDALPAWNPRAAGLDEDTVAELRAGKSPRLPVATAPVWDGERPHSMEQWVALGRQVFFTYPLRPEVSAQHAIADETLARGLGLHAVDGDPAATGGVYPGLVVFRATDGTDQIGITCALCHSTPEHGELVVGRARRDFDYGAMRMAWHQASGEFIDPRLGARMTSWGPGRADITEDDDQDPVAIPDLWQLRSLRYLTQAATIIHDRRDGNATPLALAIRQETQFIHAGGERTRPPRELAWALTMFLYSLEAPQAAADAPQADTKQAELARGRVLFERHCLDCHGDANHSGEAVAAGRVGTDRALADGTSRGTGLYRPAPLIGVAAAGPYLHDGTVATLEDLLDPERLHREFDRGVRAPGLVPGHTYGTRLSAPDRDALVAWLRTL